MDRIFLKNLPKKLEYAELQYTFFTHLEDVAQKALDAGENLLEVVVTNRKRKGMYYHPRFNRKFVKSYYYKHGWKNHPLTYYKNENAKTTT